MVIVKLGKTEKSAAHALSHSGAIVGDYDAFAALCRRHNAVLVRDSDELISTAMLFASGRRPSAPHIAGILDSGGMREQMMDLAADYGVTFAEVDPRTRRRMQEFLDHGLHPDNPLDAMGALGRNSEETFRECGKALLDDVDTGLFTCEFEFRDGFSHYPELFDALHALHEHSDKPVVAVNSSTFACLAESAAELTRRGIPCINGIDLALRSIRNLVAYGRHPREETAVAEAKISSDPTKIARWESDFHEHGPRSEQVSLALLGELGFPVIQYLQADSEDKVLACAETIGYPVVLKSAAANLLHKTEHGGVVTGIEDPMRLAAAYKDMVHRLGSEVLIMRQARGNVELALGMKRDPQYGPLVIVASGGTMIEETADRAIALAPVTPREAREMMEGLSVYPALRGGRGKAGSDVSAIVDLIVDFSLLAAELAPFIAEMDINPVIVDRDRLDIVDALIVAG